MKASISSSLIPVIHSFKFFSLHQQIKVKIVNQKINYGLSIVYFTIKEKQYELNKNGVRKQKIIFTYRFSRSRFLLTSSALHLLSKTQSRVRPSSSSSQPGKKISIKESLHKPSGQNCQKYPGFYSVKRLGVSPSIPPE